MADVVMKIIDVGIAIKEAIHTARSNHREFMATAKVADHVCGLMRMLDARSGLVHHPVVAGTLGSVLDSMEEALELVRRLGKKSIVLQLITAQSTAKKLARVQREILQKISLGTLAVTVATAVNLSRPQRSLQLSEPVHCRSRVDVAQMLDVIYNGTNIQMIEWVTDDVTPKTTGTVDIAMRASGAQIIFASRHGNGNNLIFMIGIGLPLNCVIFHDILSHHGVRRGLVRYGGSFGANDTEELCDRLLNPPTNFSPSLYDSPPPQISEISEDSDDSN